MDASFRCWIILTGTLLTSYVAWRLARPSTAREAERSRYGGRFIEPVTGVFRDGPTGVTIILSGRLTYELPDAGGQITFEDRINGETLDAGSPIEERGAGTLRFRDVVQHTTGYPLTFSRTAHSTVDGRLVCVSRFGMTAEGPGTITARATTVYPAPRPTASAEPAEAVEIAPHPS